MTGEMLPFLLGLYALAFGAVLSLALVTWAKDRMWVWPVAIITGVLAVNENLSDTLRLVTGLLGIAVAAWALMGAAGPRSRWHERPPGTMLRVMQVWAALGVVWFGWLLFNNRSGVVREVVSATITVTLSADQPVALQHVAMEGLPPKAELSNSTVSAYSPDLRFGQRVLDDVDADFEVMTILIKEPPDGGRTFSYEMSVGVSVPDLYRDSLSEPGRITMRVTDIDRPTRRLSHTAQFVSQLTESQPFDVARVSVTGSGLERLTPPAPDKGVATSVIDLSIDGEDVPRKTFMPSSQHPYEITCPDGADCVAEHFLLLSDPHTPRRTFPVDVSVTATQIHDYFADPTWLAGADLQVTIDTPIEWRGTALQVTGTPTRADPFPFLIVSASTPEPFDGWPYVALVVVEDPNGTITAEPLRCQSDGCTAQVMLEEVVETTQWNVGVHWAFFGEAPGEFEGEITSLEVGFEAFR